MGEIGEAREGLERPGDHRQPGGTVAVVLDRARDAALLLLLLLVGRSAPRGGLLVGLGGAERLGISLVELGKRAGVAFMVRGIAGHRGLQRLGLGARACRIPSRLFCMSAMSCRLPLPGGDG